jgi:hypothetical protein
MVPTIPVFSFTSDGTAGSFGNLTPIQAGIASRIGGRLYAAPPGGMETAVTAWGLPLGAAPPGTSTLTVLARGFTFVRGLSYSYGGHAEASASLAVKVEEFEPTHKPVGHSGRPIDTPDFEPEHAEIAPLPSTMLGTFRLIRTEIGPQVAIIRQETFGLGLQYFQMDAEPDDPGIFTPVTPGNFYRVWIQAGQWAICEFAAEAVSNIAFDFGPIFFAFN